MSRKLGPPCCPAPPLREQTGTRKWPTRNRMHCWPIMLHLRRRHISAPYATHHPCGCRRAPTSARLPLLADGPLEYLFVVDDAKDAACPPLHALFAERKGVNARLLIAPHAAATSQKIRKWVHSVLMSPAAAKQPHCSGILWVQAAVAGRGMVGHGVMTAGRSVSTCRLNDVACRQPKVEHGDSWPCC